MGRVRGQWKYGYDRPFASRAGDGQGGSQGVINQTTFIGEGLKDIWAQSWEDFDYALPGCESSRVARIGRPEDRKQFARQYDLATAKQPDAAFSVPTQNS
jgi:hypothetical protein